MPKSKKKSTFKYDTEEIYIVIQDGHVNSYDHLDDAQAFIKSASAAGCSCSEPFGIPRSNIEKAAPVVINESIDFVKAFELFIHNESQEAIDRIKKTPELKALIEACLTFNSKTKNALALAGDGLSKDILKHYREEEKAIRKRCFWTAKVTS